MMCSIRIDFMYGLYWISRVYVYFENSLDVFKTYYEIIRKFGNRKECENANN